MPVVFNPIGKESHGTIGFCSEKIIKISRKKMASALAQGEVRYVMFVVLR